MSDYRKQHFEGFVDRIEHFKHITLDPFSKFVYSVWVVRLFNYVDINVIKFTSIFVFVLHRGEENDSTYISVCIVGYIER